MDDGSIGTVPHRKSGIGTGWDTPKRGAGDDLEERMVHFLVVRFELAPNVDNESGCDCGEQTGLFPSDQYENDTRVEMREMLTKISVVSKSPSYFLTKSRS